MPFSPRRSQRLCVIFLLFFPFLRTIHKSGTHQLRHTHPLVVYSPTQTDTQLQEAFP